MIMTQDSTDHEQNIHYVSTEKDCHRMGDRHGWELEEVVHVGGGMLPWECRFKGTQTSFDADGESNTNPQES